VSDADDATYRALHVERSLYDIAVEPRGDTYRKLLAASLSHCAEFLFVDVPSRRKGTIKSAFEASARAVVRELEPFLLRVERSMSWPGTVLSEHPGLDVRAYVYRFRFEPKSLLVLTRVADRLYAWRWPDLPADLCLIRPDGEPWLVTMAADEDSYLTITQDEVEELARAVPQVGLRRHYSEH
jgi:hypothetical protein